MASNLTAIGLDVSSQAAFMALAQVVARRGQRLPAVARPGSYVHFAVGDGPEIWVQLGPEGQLNGMLPHFSGEGRMTLHLEQSIRRLSQTELDGCWQARSSPEGEPFCIDSPDFFLTPAEPGATRHAQIAAFPQKLTVYPDEATHKAASRRGTPVMSWASEPDTKEGPVALVSFSGRILEADQRFNPLYNLLYHRALVETVGGTVDLVVSANQIKKPLLKDGVVLGQFWLSGRLL